MVDNKKDNSELDEKSLREKSLEQELQLQESVEATEHRIEEEKSVELSKEEAKILREKIESTELDDHLKDQAKSDAEEVMTLEDEKVIQKLIDLAQSKGAVYAVAVAKKMDDAYVLDALHDRLSKDGYYKSLK